MKNIVRILFTIISLSAFQNLYAQAADNNIQTARSSKYEVHAGYGLLSDMQMIAAFSDVYTDFASTLTGEPVRSEYPTVGPFILGSTFFVSKRIAIGPEVNLMGLKINSYYTGGEIRRDRFFIANLSCRMDFYYVNKAQLQLYSGVALGGAYIFDQAAESSEEDNSGPFISYQLNFFGIRYGKSWAGYAECGFGRNGLMNLGVSKRF